MVPRLGSGILEPVLIVLVHLSEFLVLIGDGQVPLATPIDSMFWSLVFHDLMVIWSEHHHGGSQRDEN